jgi:hypothetical protein
VELVELVELDDGEPDPVESGGGVATRHAGAARAKNMSGI